MTVAVPVRTTEWLTAILRGEDPGTPTASQEVLDACASEDIAPLVSHLARSLPSYAAWPDALRAALESQARDAAARELAVRAELARVLTALGRAGVRALLLKGAALAYSLYHAPSHRGRADTDLLVRLDQVARAKNALEGLGYRSTPYSDGQELFSQTPLLRRDDAGLEHWIDLHWEISTARAFADALPFDELAASSVAMAALGPDARTLGPVHTLLLACLHPVMHHRNAERLAWTYDVHLLVGSLGTTDWRTFETLVQAKRLRAVATRGLQLAVHRLGTRVPEYVLAAIAPNGDPEPTAEYLTEGRGWLDELGSNLAGRQSWTRRLTLLREVAFPSARYMLASYQISGGSLGFVLLPALYVHRAVRGVWRLLAGQK